MKVNSTLAQIGADGALFEKPVEAQDVIVVPGQRVDLLVAFASEESASVAWQTLPYARGHGSDGGPSHDVFQLRMTTALPDSASWPDRLVVVEALPAATTTRELTFEEQMGHSGAGVHGGTLHAVLGPIKVIRGLVCCET